MSTVLLIGASRGIGHALGQRFVQAGWTVITAARQPPAMPLQPPHRYIRCDVCAEQDIEGLARELGDAPLDLLWYNVGMAVLPESLETVTSEQLHHVFQVNAFGAFLTTRALLPNLKRSAKPKIIFTTSREGSISDNSSGSHYIYRASKAALHQFGKTLALELSKLPTPIPLLLLHPGMVETDATRPVLETMDPRPPGILQPDEAAEKLFARAEELDMQKTGRFLHRDGDLFGAAEQSPLSRRDLATAQKLLKRAV